MAIDLCLKGPTVQSVEFVREMRRIQEDLFEKEKRSLQTDGIPVEGDIQWVDVEDRFYPMGLKAIGIFCSEIAKTEWVDRDKYIVGFQDVPKENPYLGEFEWEETKASMRVPSDVHQAIEKGLSPPLSEIVPIASRQAGGISDACHRYSAACTIGKNKKSVLIRSLANVLTEKL